MNCFIKKTTNKTPKPLPPGLNYNNLFPEYSISTFENESKKALKGTNIIVSQQKLKNENYSYAKKYPWIKTVSFNLISSKDKKEYFCVKISNKNCKDPHTILVFSNGENSNLCGMIPILTDLSSYLRINILAYDYPELDDNLSLYEKEQEMLQATLTVISYTYALHRNESIILMGYSTGVYLNLKIVQYLINKSKIFKSKLKHIINISPMWCFHPSFSKKIFHNRKYANFITNIVKIINLKLKISTFIAHGVKDDQIGYMISMKICSRTNFVYEWYPKEGDHYNIILKDLYRRKLLQRLKKFLSVDNSIIIGEELDDTALSKITNEGIKVNIMKDASKLSGNNNNNISTSYCKDLDISSGNFFFGSDKKNNSNINININTNIINEEKSGEKKSSGNKSIKNIMVNESYNIIQDRKESGFSFLDISLQKMNINFGENIDEMNNEENSDEDEFNYDYNKEKKIGDFDGKIKSDDDNEIDNDNIDEEEDEESKKVINKINIVNNINIFHNTNNINETNIKNNTKENEQNDDGIINIVSSIVKEKNEILNESTNKKDQKGFLINDSFGVNNINSGDKYTFEISFRKEENNI